MLLSCRNNEPLCRTLTRVKPRDKCHPWEKTSSSVLLLEDSFQLFVPSFFCWWKIPPIIFNWPNSHPFQIQIIILPCVARKEALWYKKQHSVSTFHLDLHKETLKVESLGSWQLLRDKILSIKRLVQLNPHQ